jgi:hypothetical protein
VGGREGGREGDVPTSGFYTVLRVRPCPVFGDTTFVVDEVGRGIRDFKERGH